MNYRELRTELKAFQALGYKVPNLSSPKSVLQLAYDQLKAQNTKAIEVIKEYDFGFTGDSGSVFRLVRFNFDLKVLGDAALYTISFLKFLLIFFVVPFLKKALQLALIAAVYAAILIKEYLLPKLLIALYYLGVLGLTIALRVLSKKNNLDLVFD